MAKRKPSLTKRLRNLVSKQINRMEQRGYRVADDIKENVKTKGAGYLKGLREQGYKKLYNESTAEIDGKIVSGDIARKNERREVAQKAARTRKDKWDKEHSDLYQEGQIVYDNINELINRYPTKGSEKLKRELASQISRYGLTKVMISMGQYPDYIISLAQEIIFYEADASEISSSFEALFSAITGEISEEETLEMLGEALDDMSDYSEEY